MIDPLIIPRAGVPAACDGRSSLELLALSTELVRVLADGTACSIVEASRLRVDLEREVDRRSVGAAEVLDDVAEDVLELTDRTNRVERELAVEGSDARRLSKLFPKPGRSRSPSTR